MIYGVAVISGCMLAGTVFGKLIGQLLGIDANVGGVGFAMLLLLFITSRSSGKLSFNSAIKPGIGFWSAMYIPIVVAMASIQNVTAALQSGWIALLAGFLAVAASFALIPWLSRLVASGQTK
ncbi:MAG: malonate transporter subunit MadL [Novosphingobium sp.]|nr:malonate transporter subunit MadL [Novosphingobium sp.]